MKLHVRVMALGISCFTLLVGCQTASVQYCEQHGVRLEERVGFDRKNYHVFPTDAWYEVMQKYPHYDKGLINDRQSKRSPEFSRFRKDWVCPVCQKEGEALLRQR